LRLMEIIFSIMKNEFRKIKVPVTENEQFLVTAVVGSYYF